MTKTIKIDGMACAHCAAGVERALNGLDGVSNVNVSLENKCAVIEATDAVADADIKEAVYDAGFDVTDIESK